MNQQVATPFGDEAKRETIHPDHAAVLEGVRKVAAKAKLLGDKIDEDRAFPLDLFDELMTTNAFLAMAPRDFGGFDMPLELINESIIEGARANGSLGWLMMVGTAQSVGYGSRTKSISQKLVGSKERRTRTRGVIAPKGRAVPVEGGYIVNGQWPFASGGPQPDYVSGNCLVFRDGKPSIGENGMPEAIMALVPAKDVEFLDTWYVLGMKGTDSCDVAVKDLFVPEEMTHNVYAAKSSYNNPIGYLPLRVILSTGHVSVALGIAYGALDDIIELSKTKSASMNPNQKLRDDPIFRHALGEHSLRLTAMRSMLDQVTTKIWSAGAAHRGLTPEETLTGRLMSAYITQECVKIVDWAYTAGGSTSVYNNSSLQRRFRDIHVATQHAATFTDGYRTLAGVLMGETPSAADLF